MGLGSAKGNSASMGTTQGEIVVPKFFPRKGPNGTYSQAWMSLAENKHKWEKRVIRKVILFSYQITLQIIQSTLVANL